MAADSGGGSGGGHAEQEPHESEPKPFTHEEAAEHFHKKSGESQQDFYCRLGGLVKARTDAAGANLQKPSRSKGGKSVYLHGQGKDQHLTVRIADHAKGGRKPRRPAGEVNILIKGSTVGIQTVNEALSQIAARRK